MDDGAPGDVDALVDGLRAEDAGRAGFVLDLAGLVEDEGEDVLVVGDRDDGLHHELPVPRHGGSAGTVVCVLPAYARVLLVDADDIIHWHWIAVGVAKDGVEVVDGSEAVAAQF